MTWRVLQRLFERPEPGLQRRNRRKPLHVALGMRGLPGRNAPVRYVKPLLHARRIKDRGGDVQVKFVGVADPHTPVFGLHHGVVRPVCDQALVNPIVDLALGLALVVGPGEQANEI